MSKERRIPLAGSERSAVSGAEQVGPANPNERVDVTLVLRPRTDAPATLPEPGAAPLTRRALGELRGADPGDVAAVRAFAAAHDLAVGPVSLSRRRVVVSGTIAALSAAFGVEILQFRAGDARFRGRTGAVHLPPELADRVVAVLGLDDRPQARAHFRMLAQDADANERSPTAAPAGGPTGHLAIPSAAAGVSYTPVVLSELYDFPAGDGAGQTIAIIELGGGYRKRDLTAYFKRLGLAAPVVTSVSVDGAKNKPVGSPNSADGEVVLDIEIAGSIAPKAAIAVYFAPNTDRGFLDAITAAVHDARRKPSIISISWGAAETAWTSQAMQAFDQAFQDAALAGVSVFAAAGDNGSGDAATDRLAHVDFPASSPHVTGCGGTSLTAASSGKTIVKETVWNDGPGSGATGGGVSATFPLPAWQASAGVPASANPGGATGRGVPDVAGDADPATGYEVLVDGTSAVFGGTSAVAPLWAGLTARINQSIGRPAGFLNPVLYTAGETVFRDITEGSNGAYSAAPGWDPCTGFGSPRGRELLGLFSNRATKSS